MFCRRRLLQALIFLPLLAWAEVAPATEPEDVGILFRWDSQKFRSLEMHNAVASSDIDFFSGQLTYITIPGPRSECRYPSGASVDFYLRVFLDLADPRAAFFPVKDPTRFAIFRLEKERNDRRLLLKDEGLTDTRRFAGAPLLARLHGSTSFRLAPSEALTAGEYAIKYSFPEEERFRLFCFGVDGP